MNRDLTNLGYVAVAAEKLAADPAADRWYGVIHEAVVTGAGYIAMPFNDRFTGGEWLASEAKAVADEFVNADAVGLASHRAEILSDVIGLAEIASADLPMIAEAARDYLDAVAKLKAA